MTVLDRRQTPRGELVLRQVEDAFEIISNGVFLMDSRSGVSERLLMSAALQRAGSPRQVLIGGLGMGFTLRAAVSDRRIERITVVEIEPAVIEWHRSWLVPLTGHALADPRVEVLRDDLVGLVQATDAMWDVVCLDVDNGPQWTVVDENAWLYGDCGLEVIRARLGAGGLAAFWSAEPVPGFADRLAGHFDEVEQLEVPVGRGAPDVIYLAR